MRKGVFALAIAVFLWQVYRAAVTVATPGEAVMVTQFASRPFATIVASPFNPSNQILHTLLVARFVRTFRLTEFTMRMGSLFGFAVYIWAVFRLFLDKKWGWLALIFCLLNPFTVGWLPESTGMWMAAGLSLLALRNVDKNDFRTASLQFAFAIGFDLSFSTLVFFIATCSPTSARCFKLTRDYLISILLIVVAVWSITILRTPPLVWQTATPLWIDTLVLVPALAAFLIARIPRWQSIAGCAVGICGLAGIFSAFSYDIPNRFRVGALEGLPRASRALRDEIRRHDLELVRVAVSDNLQTSFNFYRRRYALGAVETIQDFGRADYWLTSDADAHLHARDGMIRIFQRNGISVFRRD